MGLFQKVFAMGCNLGLALSLGGVSAIAVAQVRPAVVNQSTLEKVLVQPDWSAVAKRIASERTVNAGVRKLINGHALLALNRGDEAMCLFASASDAELVEWEAWTGDFVHRHSASAAAHYLLADALVRRKKWDSALEEFQRTLDRDPQFALALNARGVALAVQGQPARALEDLQKAIAADPLFGDAQLSKGFFYIQDQVATGAQNAFRHALQLMPASALARTGLGYVEVVENRWARGKSDIEAAGNQSMCLAPLLATNLANIIRWESEGQFAQSTAGQTADLGTTLNSILTRATSGDANAIDEAIQYGAAHPESQSKVAYTLQSASSKIPGAQKVIAERIAKFSDDTQQRADQAGVVSKLSSKTSAGVGVGGLNLSTEVEVQKNGTALQQKAAEDVNFAKVLQKAVPESTTKQGGVTTSLTAAAHDRGHWPIKPHYTLAYTGDRADLP